MRILILDATNIIAIMLSMNLKQKLLAVADAHHAATGRSHARIATIVTNRSGFFRDIRGGGECTLGTYEKVMSWFSDNWPTGLEWPDGVDRPEAKQDAE